MKYTLVLSLFILSLKLFSQNIKITNIKKLYYYKTVDDFFSNKKDSIVADDITYDYGKISFTNKLTNKKVKFHLHSDSSIFAFRVAGDPTNPIYAINGKEKRYGVFMGGSKNLYLVFYSRGNLRFVTYDKNNYITSYSGSIDEFGYYLIFVKQGFESKRNGEIEFFIQDNIDLHKKYVLEKEDATTYNWVKNYIIKQIEYLGLYNNPN
jgi:hypothetical protein